jgi:hypothetical protein
MATSFWVAPMNEGHGFSLFGSVKASGAVQIGQLKNLIWTGLKFSRPCGLDFVMVVLTQTLKLSSAQPET